MRSHLELPGEKTAVIVTIIWRLQLPSHRKQLTPQGNWRPLLGAREVSSQAPGSRLQAPRVQEGEGRTETTSRTASEAFMFLASLGAWES